MKEKQSEKTLEDKEDLDIQEHESWQLVTSGNRQHSSSECVAVQLVNKYEALALNKKESTPAAGEDK